MSAETYWQESFEIALDSLNLFHLVEQMTPEQRAQIGESLANSAEHQSMACYTPSPSDRVSSIEREWQQKYDRLEAEFNAFRGNADEALRKALRQPRDAIIGIGAYGEVTRYDGRTTVIQ